MNTEIRKLCVIHSWIPPIPLFLTPSVLPALQDIPGRWHELVRTFTTDDMEKGQTHSFTHAVFLSFLQAERESAKEDVALEFILQLPTTTYFPDVNAWG